MCKKLYSVVYQVGINIRYIYKHYWKSSLHDVDMGFDVNLVNTSLN